MYRYNVNLVPTSFQLRNGHRKYHINFLKYHLPSSNIICCSFLNLVPSYYIHT